MSYWFPMHSKWNLFSFVFAVFGSSGWWLVCSVDAGEYPFQEISWQLFDSYGKLKSWTCIKWKVIDYAVREDVYYIIEVILHFREALQAKTFYLWWRKYQLIMDIRMMERMVRVISARIQVLAVYSLCTLAIPLALFIVRLHTTPPGTQPKGMFKLLFSI